jgi:hypothetical protein
MLFLYVDIILDCLALLGVWVLEAQVIVDYLETGVTDVCEESVPNSLLDADGVIEGSLYDGFVGCLICW